MKDNLPLNGDKDKSTDLHESLQIFEAFLKGSLQRIYFPIRPIRALDSR